MSATNNICHEYSRFMYTNSEKINKLLKVPTSDKLTKLLSVINKLQKVKGSLENKNLPFKKSMIKSELNIVNGKIKSVHEQILHEQEKLEKATYNKKEVVQLIKEFTDSLKGDKKFVCFKCQSGGKFWTSSGMYGENNDYVSCEKCSGEGYFVDANILLNKMYSTWDYNKKFLMLAAKEFNKKQK